MGRLSNRSLLFIWAIIIIVISYISYQDVLDNGFVNFDDGKYVLENTLIKDFSSENIKAIFSEYRSGNYHPISILSYTFDYHFSKLDPHLYHLVNLILHLINTLLVLLFIYILTDNLKIAVITAALFGVSTIHVESVAWISERKDVLYTMFYLLSLISYVRYIKTQKSIYFIFSLLLFLISILSKGMAVSLALSVGAIDYVLSRKLLSRKVILEKVPFFILSIIFGLVAIYAQKEKGAISFGETYSFLDRIVLASYSLAQYIYKTIVPINLSIINPYPAKINGILPIGYFFYLLTIPAFITAFILSYKRSRLLAFGLAFFIINIFMVLQLLQVGGAIMADRYSYVSSIGIFIMIGVVYTKVLRKNSFQKYLKIVIIVGYIVILSVFTNNRVLVWKDSLSLWDDTIKKCPGVSVAWYNRGLAKNSLNDVAGALHDYNNAIKLDPEYTLVYISRGIANYNLGAYNKAIKDFDRYILEVTNDPEAYLSRGASKFQLGDFGGAIQDFNSTINIRPNYTNAYFNRALASLNTGNYQVAINDFDKFLSVYSEHPFAYSNRGVAKTKLGYHADAILDFTKAINLKKDYGEAYYFRGSARIELDQNGAACLDFRKAGELGINEAGSALQEHCGFE